jgi:hypothetical protein
MLDLDFNHKRTLDWDRRRVYSENFAALIERVAPQMMRLAHLVEIIADIDANPTTPEEPRPGRAVSAGAVGDDCARRVQLNIWATFHPDDPVPKEEPVDAKLQAAFDLGKRTEPLMAEWIKRAGFNLVTEDPRAAEAPDQHPLRSRQFGFRVARNAAGSSEFKGFADGVIYGYGPAAPLVLWENKTLAAKYWRATAKHGVIKQSPKYDTQVQLLMGYLDIPSTLFTYLNPETGEIYAELVAFNQARAQAASDRAVRILQATRAGELLPKAAKDGDTFPCKQCKRFRGECW